MCYLLFLLVFLPSGNLPLQSYWSLSCDHGLHCSDELMWTTSSVVPYRMCFSVHVVRMPPTIAFGLAYGLRLNFFLVIIWPFLMQFLRFKNGSFSPKAKKTESYAQPKTKQFSSQKNMNSSLTRRPRSFLAPDCSRLEVTIWGSCLSHYIGFYMVYYL